MDSNKFQSIGHNSSNLKSLIGSSTFRNLKLTQDSAIFGKCRINYSPSHPITHLVVNNNHLALAMTNKVLIRIDLSSPSNIEELDLNKFSSPNSTIYKIFLDPLGFHLIISLSENDESAPAEALYLHWKNNRAKAIVKVKGALITSVGWNPKIVNETLTGQILVGTSAGLIYELELTSDEKLLQSGHERNFKQVFDFSESLDVPFVCDLKILNSPTEDLFYLILCCTPTKLIKFSGYSKSYDDKFIFCHIFQNYSYSGLHYDFIEHPNTYPNSNLQISHYKDESKLTSFTWVVKDTIYSKDIVWTEVSSLLKDIKHSTFPESCCLEQPIVDFVLTDFHIIITWKDQVVALCLLNNQVVFEDFALEEIEQFNGIYKDFTKGTVWVFASNIIQKYKIDKEDRNIWQIYVERNDFELAKKYCKSDEVLMAYVLIKEAEFLFKQKKYLASAELFAKTPSSFEEVCLMLMDANEDESLKLYLTRKLQGLNQNDPTQLTLIVLWLMELHIRKLGMLRDTDKKYTKEYSLTDQDFQEFLQNAKVRRVIHQNAQAVYTLLASHNDQDNYVGIALIMKDFNRVILHLISHQRHAEALEVMCTQNSDKLFYQHIPSLLQVIPKATISALMAQGKKLSPVMLLPSLVHAYSSYGLTEEVLNYIEHCVDKLDVKDTVIHNFLITLYCTWNSEKLLSYLKLQGEDSECVNYDPKFALRECATAGHDEACIHILTTMELHQEAVSMALKFNTSLAKAIANKIKHSQPEVSKKLWLEIAAHVIQKEENVSRAMEVLKECDLIKIEDILPFFPDFVTIDLFKDAICDSLQEYNEHIDNLVQEMDEATNMADDIRSEIKKSKQNHFIVRAQDRCCECDFPIITRSFYLFPCSHKFHQDCLTESVMGSLSRVKQKQVSELKGKLIALSATEESTKGVGSTYWSEREQLRLKIDSIVASECLYCGDIAVNNVDNPFIPDEEWKTQIDEWL